jgi:hypothetical protein
MKNRSITALIVTLGLANTVHASTLLFADNFNESASNSSVSTFNNNLASTQSGSLATVSYTVQGYSYVAQHSDTSNYLLVANATDGNRYGNISLNNDFATQANAANQALQISFNINSVSGYSDTTRWVQFNIGSGQNLAVADGGTSTAILFRVNGGAQILSQGSALVSSAAWAANDLVTINLSGTGGTGSAFNGNGSEASISIGGTNYGTFALAQQSSAYLNFSAYNYSNSQFGVGRFDNLSVALVPEPQTAMMLSVLGIFTLLRRRRL